jgi:AraC-like DNA-binding protein
LEQNTVGGINLTDNIENLVKEYTIGEYCIKDTEEFKKLSRIIVTYFSTSELFDKLTEEKLAEKVGVSKDYIHDIISKEGDHPLRTQEAEKFIRYFNSSELIGDVLTAAKGYGASDLNEHIHHRLANTDKSTALLIREVASVLGTNIRTLSEQVADVESTIAGKASKEYVNQKMTEVSSQAEGKSEEIKKQIGTIETKVQGELLKRPTSEEVESLIHQIPAQKAQPGEQYDNTNVIKVIKETEQIIADCYNILKIPKIRNL